MSDSDFWLPRDEIEAAANAALESVNAQAAGEPTMVELVWGFRADWEDGSAVILELLPVMDRLYARLSYTVRLGAWREQAWELSPWARPHEGVVRIHGGEGPQRSLSGGALRDHPFGDERPSPKVALNAKAAEVLQALGETIRTARSSSSSCVVCHKVIEKGTNYREQAGSKSGNRRVHFPGCCVEVP